MVIDAVEPPPAGAASQADHWPDRNALRSDDGGPGTITCSAAADIVVRASDAQRDHAVECTAAALTGAGLRSQDRVLVAVAVDGDGSGALLLEAMRSVVRSVGHIDARGRTRLLAAIRAVRPTTLVVTPTGAADLLARLHLEFLVDPMELGLQRLLVVGEIVSDATLRHLASEFEAEVVQLWSDPVLGVGLGWRSPGTPDVQLVDDAVHLARLDADDTGVTEGELAEWTVDLWRFAAISESPFRTGFVAAASTVGAPGTVPVPVSTVGDHVLVRGRWFSLPALERALRPVDGIVSWTMTISRSGTLDRAALHVALGRDSLVDNPMWEARLREAVRAVTPISVDVTTGPAFDREPGAVVCDERPQHLGRDRRAVARRSGHV